MKRIELRRVTFVLSSVLMISLAGCFAESIDDPIKGKEGCAILEDAVEERCGPGRLQFDCQSVNECGTGPIAHWSLSDSLDCADEIRDANTCEGVARVRCNIGCDRALFE